MRNLISAAAASLIIASTLIANAQEPATVKARCAVAKSTTVETTADGRTVIRVKSVTICK